MPPNDALLQPDPRLVAPLLAVSPTPAVRARIAGRPEPPFDRLFDPLLADLVGDGPIARERFSTRWSDTAALTELGRAKLAPLAPPLAMALADYHRRLGAPEAARHALDRLARGEAVAAIAGQQPGPLGGPLYTLHKTAATVGLARAYQARTGIPCVPVYWMHGEDSDFDEIKGVSIFDRALQLMDLAIAPGFHAEGGLVGAVEARSLEPVHAAALGAWTDLPGTADIVALLSPGIAAARDLGEVQAALMLALFGAQGLVVVDPRLPEFRTAARPILDRYLANADALHEAARAAGNWLEARVGRRPRIGRAPLE